MRRRNDTAKVRKAQRAWLQASSLATVAAAAVTVGISPTAMASPPAPAAGAAFHYIKSFGSGNGMKSGPGQFSTPGGADFAPGTGDLLATDRMNDRVQEFSPAGKFIRAFGKDGTKPGQFRGPYGLGINKAGDIYVADDGNFRVQEFSPKRVFIRAFGHKIFTSGPADLAVADDGTVYVGDGPNIREFTGNGHYVGSFGGTGSGPGQFNSTIAGLAVGPHGHVYAGDYSGFRVEEFTRAGVFVRSLANHGKAKVEGPIGVAVDASLNVFVSDNGHVRAIELNPNGSLKRVFGTSGPGKLDNPGPMALDCAGHVYDLDTDVGRVREYGNPAAKGPPC